MLSLVLLLLLLLLPLLLLLLLLLVLLLLLLVQLLTSRYLLDALKHTGVAVCVGESLKARSLHCFGTSLAIAFTFYMVVFHTLSNLPLDQALYFEVMCVSA